MIHLSVTSTTESSNGVSSLGRWILIRAVAQWLRFPEPLDKVSISRAGRERIGMEPEGAQHLPINAIES